MKGNLRIFNSKLLYDGLKFFPIILLIYFLYDQMFSDLNASSSKIEEKIIQEIKRKQKAILSPRITFNERVLKKMLANLWISKNNQINPDIVFLGNSKLYEINSQNFSRKKILNLSVSDGKLEESLGLYYNLILKKIVPKEVVICIDPETFNERNADLRFNGHQTNFQFIASDILAMFDLLKEETHFVNRWEFYRQKIDFYSPKIFQNYWQMMLFKKLKLLEEDKSDSIILDDEATQAYGNYDLIGDDGHREYRRNTHGIEEKSSSSLAAEYANKRPYIYSLGGYNRYNLKLELLLRKFVRYLKEQNVQVVFFIPPYHPVAYKIFKERDDMGLVINFDVYAKKLGRELGVTIMGSVNPITLNLTEKDFMDGQHMNEHGVLTVTNLLDFF